jgi:hypothetical protein
LNAGLAAAVRPSDGQGDGEKMFVHSHSWIHYSKILLGKLKKRPAKRLWRLPLSLSLSLPTL